MSGTRADKRKEIEERKRLYEQDPELFMAIQHLKDEGYRIVKLGPKAFALSSRFEDFVGEEL